MKRDTLLIVAVVAGVYLYSQRAAPRVAGPSGSVAPSTGTRISIPGVGDYRNAPGGGVSIQLDPGLFGGYGNAVPPNQAPVIAQPSPAPDYQNWDYATSPIDVYPYDVGGVYAV